MIYDTLDLSAVEIFSRKVDKMAGYKVLEVDSIIIDDHRTGTLAEMLSSSAPLFIKNYGSGTLATSSIRGASASHTQVIWNNMNINSPMPGQSDFSLIPNFFIDNVKVYFGAGSIFETSGGLGGSIHVSDRVDWKNKLKVRLMQDVGSFETYKTHGLIGFGNQKIQSATKFFFVNSRNDFTFHNNAIDPENPPEETRKNAGYRQFGLYQNLAVKIGGRCTLKGRFWLQSNHRDIPSNLLVSGNGNREHSSEKFIRSTVDFQHQTGISSVLIQSGFSHNVFNYTNTISEIDSDNEVNSWTNLLEFEYFKFANLTITTSATFDLHHVNSENYKRNVERKQGSIAMGINYRLSKRLFINCVFRQELIDEKLAPFTPSAGINLRILKMHDFNFKLNIARNFHAPALNDLYWYPGGNPDLKNENGYSAETGLVFKRNPGKISLSTEITAFYNNIDNWIIWQPDSVFSYWTAYNLKNVISKGFEAGIKLSGNVDKVRWNYNFQYAFTSAHNSTRISDNDQSYNKQIIYVPEHTFNQNARIGWKQFAISWTMSYTGKRYTTSDNSRYMPSFLLHDLMLSKTFEMGKSDLKIRLSVNNLAGTDYQVIAWQPMPGRNFMFTVSYNFLRNNISRKGAEAQRIN